MLDEGCLMLRPAPVPRKDVEAAVLLKTLQINEYSRFVTSTPAQIFKAARDGIAHRVGSLRPSMARCPSWQAGYPIAYAI